MRSISISLILLLVFVLASAATAFCAQQVPLPPSFGQQPPEKDEQQQKLEKEMAKNANKRRQEEIRRDSGQLLKLATELKEYVDKSNENILSMEVVKKAEQIEKLAHSVKEKMKGP